GLKANALYRDGCKLSQPLSNKSDKLEEVDLEQEVDVLGESDLREEVTSHVADLGAAAARGDLPAAREAEVRIVERPMRRRLPDTRRSFTHKFNVAGHEGYLTVGVYEDGRPGELFITMAKEGSTIGGLMDSLGTATSVALQYGVPIESLVNKFTHQRFEPAGMTMNPETPFAKSLVDYIVRWMGMQFVPGYREAVAPKRSTDAGKTQRLSDAPSALPRFRGENGDAPSAPAPEPVAASSPKKSAPRDESSLEPASSADVLSLAMRDMQGDAPACEVCGTITVRNGTCYKCLNCGHSMGCS